jgi:hypothetical protein
MKLILPNGLNMFVKELRLQIVYAEFESAESLTYLKDEKKVKD